MNPTSKRYIKDTELLTGGPSGGQKNFFVKLNYFYKPQFFFKKLSDCTKYIYSYDLCPFQEVFYAMSLKVSVFQGSYIKL